MAEVSEIVTSAAAELGRSTLRAKERPVTAKTKYAKLSLLTLEARDVPAQLYQVNFEIPSQGESALTITDGGLHTTGEMTANSSVDAVMQALGDSVIVGNQTYELTPETISTKLADQQPFLLVETEAGFEVRLEDLVATPEVSGWGYNDHAWLITAEERAEYQQGDDTDELNHEALAAAVCGELNSYFLVGGNARLLSFISGINRNGMTDCQNFIFVDDGMNGTSSTTSEYRLNNNRLFSQIIITSRSLEGLVFNEMTVDYIKYTAPMINDGVPAQADPVPQPPKSITIGTNDDTIQSIANWWNRRIHDHTMTIDVNPDEAKWKTAIAELEKILDGSLTYIVFAGHGGPDHFGPFKLEDLRDPDSKASQFMKLLRQKMAPNAMIEIKACETCAQKDGVADKEMLKLVAKYTQGKVIGYDDKYGPVPHGQQYIIHPDGKVTEGITYSRFEKTWEGWLWKKKKEKKEIIRIINQHGTPHVP